MPSTELKSSLGGKTGKAIDRDDEHIDVCLRIIRAAPDEDDPHKR